MTKLNCSHVILAAATWTYLCVVVSGRSLRTRSEQIDNSIPAPYKRRNQETINNDEENPSFDGDVQAVIDLAMRRTARWPEGVDDYIAQKQLEKLGSLEGDLFDVFFTAQGDLNAFQEVNLTATPATVAPSAPSSPPSLVLETVAATTSATAVPTQASTDSPSTSSPTVVANITALPTMTPTALASDSPEITATSTTAPTLVATSATTTLSPTLSPSGSPITASPTSTPTSVSTTTTTTVLSTASPTGSPTDGVQTTTTDESDIFDEVDNEDEASASEATSPPSAVEEETATEFGAPDINTNNTVAGFALPSFTTGVISSVVVQIVNSTDTTNATLNDTIWGDEGEVDPSIATADSPFLSNVTNLESVGLQGGNGGDSVTPDTTSTAGLLSQFAEQLGNIMGMGNNSIVSLSEGNTVPNASAVTVNSVILTEPDTDVVDEEDTNESDVDETSAPQQTATEEPVKVAENNDEISEEVMDTNDSTEDKEETTTDAGDSVTSGEESDATGSDEVTDEPTEAVDEENNAGAGEEATEDVDEENADENDVNDSGVADNGDAKSPSSNAGSESTTDESDGSDGEDEPESPTELDNGPSTTQQNDSETSETVVETDNGDQSNGKDEPKKSFTDSDANDTTSDNSDEAGKDEGEGESEVTAEASSSLVDSNTDSFDPFAVELPAQFTPGPFSCNNQEATHLNVVNYVFNLEYEPDAKLDTILTELEWAIQVALSTRILSCINPDAEAAGIVAQNTLPEDEIVARNGPSCNVTSDTANQCAMYEGRVSLFLTDAKNSNEADVLLRTSIADLFRDDEFVDEIGNGLVRATYVGPLLSEPILVVDAQNEDNSASGIAQPENSSISSASLAVTVASAAAFAILVAAVYFYRRRSEDEYEISNDGSQEAPLAPQDDDDKDRSNSPFSEMLPSAYRFSGNMSVMSGEAEGSSVSGLSAVIENPSGESSRDESSIMVSESGYTTEAGGSDTMSYLDMPKSLYNRNSESPGSILGAKKREENIITAKANAASVSFDEMSDVSESPNNSPRGKSTSSPVLLASMDNNKDMNDESVDMDEALIFTDDK